ncbi:T9SS type A sorting domain-containing protein [Pareuzebyella sediminis]|uniref:T9SS type A sorting domain-containing protein n=1 Tax=Pareuzebyella sediminis TaxID=2607998 RepID=UPI0011EFB6F5|nr:T9SS type A sorting domain-containing protein [Pareuzebyella sediminis]
MRPIYFALFIVFSTMLYAQEPQTLQNQKNEEIADFKLYPNPAFGDVVQVITKDNDIKTILVYDVFGEVVLRDQIETSHLNISRLSPGVYVLQISENQRTITRKLVIK